jgi:hypothetical protein
VVGFCWERDCTDRIPLHHVCAWLYPELITAKNGLTATTGQVTVKDLWDKGALKADGKSSQFLVTATTTTIT